MNRTKVIALLDPCGTFVRVQQFSIEYLVKTIFQIQRNLYVLLLLA